MTTTTQDFNPSPPSTDREALRRPLPRLGLRTLLGLAAALLVLQWGLVGTNARPETLVEGVPNIVDFLSRLLPPEFEFEQGTVRAYTFFPFEERVPETLQGSARLRAARPVDDEALADLSTTQQVGYLYRAPNQRYFYSPEEAFELNAVSVEEALAAGAITPEEAATLDRVSLDVTQALLNRETFILDGAQYLYINRPGSEPFILDEGTYFSDRYPVPEGYVLIAKEYLVRQGEVFVGWPIIINAMVITIQMALIGTLGAVLLAVPFGLLAARNISPSPFVYQATRLILNANRAVPELIYALIFVAAVGLGPFPGVLALIVGSIGSLGKLYAEAFEQIDPQQVAAIRATGASPIRVFNFAVIPQAFPLMASYSLLLFESNVRAATILGIVGAGGIGLILQKYYGLFQYQLLMGAVLGIIVFVTIIDRLSDRIRKRII